MFDYVIIALTVVGDFQLKVQTSKFNLQLYSV